MLDHGCPPRKKQKSVHDKYLLKQSHICVLQGVLPPQAHQIDFRNSRVRKRYKGEGYGDNISPSTLWSKNAENASVVEMQDFYHLPGIYLPTCSLLTNLSQPTESFVGGTMI